MEQKQARKQPKALRALYTTIIFTGHLCLGLNVAILGPSLVDLRYLMGNVEAKQPASMEAISTQSTCMMIGCMIGGFLSFAYKWKLLEPYLNRQLLTSILIILVGLTTGLTPLTRSIYIYDAIYIINGIGSGNWVAIAITWLIEMWSGRVLAAILQAVQLCYGVGTILAPLLVRPYLYGYMNKTEVAKISVELYGKIIDERRDSLTIPYVIAGSISVCVGLSLLVLYFTWCLRYQNISETSQSEEDSSEAKLLDLPQNRSKLLLFLPLIIIIFAGNNLAEVAYSGFQDTFLQSLTSVKITAPQAAEIGAIEATSYTVGRGANILVSMVLSAGNLLLLHYCLALAGFTSLLWSTRTSITWIRVNVALIGYSFSALMPSVYMFINAYAKVDDRRNAMFTIALTVPSIFTPLLIGHYIEKFPSVLIYLILVVLLVTIGFFLLVRFWVVRKADQPVGQQQVERNQKF